MLDDIVRDEEPFGGYCEPSPLLGELSGADEPFGRAPHAFEAVRTETCGEPFEVDALGRPPCRPGSPRPRMGSSGARRRRRSGPRGRCPDRGHRSSRRCCGGRGSRGGRSSRPRSARIRPGSAFRGPVGIPARSAPRRRRAARRAPRGGRRPCRARW